MQWGVPASWGEGQKEITKLFTGKKCYLIDTEIVKFGLIQIYLELFWGKTIQEEEIFCGRKTGQVSPTTNANSKGEGFAMSYNFLLLQQERTYSLSFCFCF